MSKQIVLFLFCAVFLFVGCNESSDLSEEPTGRLILDSQRNEIISYDLQSRTATPIFTKPDSYLAWVWELDATSVTDQIVMAYTPPPATNEPSRFDRSGLFILPITGGEPDHLIGGDKKDEYYFNPIWSADANFIFYVRQTIDTLADGSFKTHYYLERLNMNNGNVDLLADRVVWPRVSNGDDKVVYASYDDELDQFGLEVVNADGTGRKVLLEIGELGSISTPMFSDDDKWIYFTVGAEDAAAQSLLDKLTGVQVAEAHARHEVASHWWRIPAEGGTPEQITANKQNILYGDFSPVSDHIAYTTNTGGLYIIHPDGTGEELLLEDTIYKTMAWLP